MISYWFVINNNLNNLSIFLFEICSGSQKTKTLYLIICLVVYIVFCIKYFLFHELLILLYIKQENQNQLDR